jgi:VWFA-related protein
VTVLLLPLVLLLQAQPDGQTPPRFRTSTRLVVQTVAVKDSSGQPVRGLGPADFALTEDGKPQQIAFVEYQPLEDAPPLTATRPAEAVAPLTQGVRVPVPGDVRYRGRRLLVLYFDLFNMGPFDQARMYAAADRYIATAMTPADLIAVMVFERGVARLRQDFTDDRTVLRSLVASLAAVEDDSGDAVRVTAGAGSAFGEDDDTFNLFTTDRQLSALQTAVTGFGALPEIKTLLYLGSGLRLTGTDNQAQLRATVNAAVRANVTINPIDTRGLLARPPLGDATQASPGGLAMFSGALLEAGLNRQQQIQDSYYALARDTGGRATFDDNDLAAGMARAARAVTGYYLIGYYTSNPIPDGRYRRVRIALTGASRAELSHRPGYYGDKPYERFNAADKERQLEEAFRLDDPITDIPMALEVNYFQINHAEYFVPVSLRMPGSELTRPRSDGAARAAIDVLAEIKDGYGVTVRNAKDRLQFSLDPAAASRAVRRPIQYETGFTLLPGEYVIKMLARNSETGRIGTFQTPFTIPNLEREPRRLPISSVILGEQHATAGHALYNVRQKIPGDAANPLVADGRRLIPAVTRIFSGTRPLIAFLQAYEHGAAAMRPLVAFATVYAEGAVVLDGGPLGIERGWDAASKAVSISVSVPLETVPDGSYALQITVLDPSAGRAVFWRTPIVVRRPTAAGRLNPGG